VTAASRVDRPRRWSLLWLAYHQVASVLGAFALAAMISHIFDLGWHAFLDTLMGYWDDYARKFMEEFFHVLLTVPLDWAFSWHVELPWWARDYVTVGAILSLSTVRADRVIPGAELLGGRSRSDYAGFLFVAILDWPLVLIVFAWLAFFDKDEDEDSRSAYLLCLTPLAYLGALFVANFVVLAHIS
jgi:hypothetical protein